MTEFFKINPLALRHCIRFEILQGTPIGQAYSNICTVLGEEVIDYKKFKIRFNHFSKKKFNDKENPCAKYLRNDKYALRVCILYESLKYQKDKRSVPVFEVFVNFCKVIGVEDVLQYPEFEFWFYRFLNGEYDLNYERDEDKKMYELMDMPIDVMKNVVEYLDILDRFKLTKTSRSLKTFVENQKLFHHTLKLNISHYEATVSLRNSINVEYFQNCLGWKRILKDPNRRVLNVEYAQHSTGYVKRINKRETVVEGVTFWKQALLDFKGVLKHPKLHLDTLEIRLHVNDEHVLNDLKNELKFTHYLNVKNVFLAEYSWGLLASIVPMLKPGYLKSINIDSYNPNTDSMDKVLKMEQWKQANYFTMDGACFMWPLHHLYHFKEFTVRLEELSLEKIREMKEFICEQEFGNALRENPHIYHYAIPNSTEYFEIKVGRWTLEAQRQKS